MAYHVDGSLIGLSASVSNPEYQEKLNKQVENILGNNESISLEALKKNSLFADAYNNLNDKAKARVDYIVNMEGDSQNVSEKELKVLLTVLDANLQKLQQYGSREFFLMDNEPTTDENGGLVQATDKELSDILKRKWKN